MEKLKNETNIGKSFFKTKTKQTSVCGKSNTGQRMQLFFRAMEIFKNEI